MTYNKSDKRKKKKITGKGKRKKQSNNGSTAGAFSSFLQCVKSHKIISLED